MRGIDGSGSQNLFPRMDTSNTKKHCVKVRAAEFKGDVQGNFFFYTEGSECLERTVMNGAGGRCNCGI